jgi:hypothetical protein
MPQMEPIFLDRLKKRQMEQAIASLKTPTDRTEFGYGQASGVYQGLVIAEQLFEEALGEEHDRT